MSIGTARSIEEYANAKQPREIGRIPQSVDRMSKAIELLQSRCSVLEDRLALALRSEPPTATANEKNGPLPMSSQLADRIGEFAVNIEACAHWLDRINTRLEL